jgi:hypothetical protein
MSSRKTLLLLSGCLLLVAAAFWYAWGRPPGHCITEANAEKIREGMSEGEVVQILGVPAGDYTTGPWDRWSLVLDHVGGGPISQKPPDWKNWVGGQGRIRVAFDEHGAVRRADFLSITRLQETPLDRLRRWLKRLGL